jgi:hypothetical protein
MEEGSNEGTKESTPNNIIRPQDNALVIKSIMESIQKNMKDLETFLNYNQRLRSAIQEIIQTFAFKNEESKKNYYYY